MYKQCQAGRINLKALLIIGGAVVVLAGGVVGVHQVRKRTVANRALAEGKAALERQDWAAACKNLRQYLSKYPDDVDILEQYAAANLAVRPLEVDNVGAAIGAYRRLLKHRAGDARITLQLAELHFGVGGFDEVRRLCRERLTADPADRKAMLLLAQSLVAQRREDEARGALEEHLALNPAHVRAYSLLSDLAARTRSPEAQAEAIQWLDQAVISNPDSAEALAYRARANRLIRGDGALAQADLEAAEALKPDDPGVRLLLVEEWTAWGNLDRAEAGLAAIEQGWFEGMAGKDAAEVEALTSSKFVAGGRLAILRGAGDEAARLADRALKELTGARRTQFLPLAVDLYLGGGNVEGARSAVAAFREASKNRTVSEPAVRDQIDLLEAGVAAAEEKPFEVINKLEEQVVRNPQSMPAWRLLADAYEKTGQAGRAVRAAEEVARRSPGDLRMLLRLARAYRDRDPAKTAHYAKLAEQVKPDSADARLLRLEAEIASAGGSSGAPAQFRKLSEELAAMRQEHPTNAMVRVMQARVAARQGRHDEADAQLRQALDACDNRLAVAMELIRQRRSRKLLAEAVEACRLAIESRSDLVIPRLVQSEIQAELGQIEGARRTLETAAAELDGQDRLAAQVALSQFLLLHGDRQKAIGMLRDLASQHPRNAQLRMGLLVLPEIQKDPTEAQKVIEEVKAIEGPRGLSWRLEQAKLWLRDEKWVDRQREIAEALGYCVQADPAWSAPAAVLGEMYERLGQLEKAEETYRRAVDAYAGNVDVLSRLLQLLEGQRRFAEARRLLDRVPAEAPQLFEHRTKVAIGLGDYEAAIGQLQQRVAADPKDVPSRVVLARLIYAHRRTAEPALKLLDEAEWLAPDPLMAIAAKAAILQAEGRQQEARSLLDAQVAQRDDFASVLLRAEYLAASGQLEAAEQDYLRLTKFAEQAAEGYLALGGFYQKAERMDEAVTAWEAGLNAEPDHLALARRLTTTLVNSADADRRSRGRELLDGLLAKHPDDSELLALRAGVLLEQRGRDAVQRAEETLERVVQLDPRHVGAHQQLVRLAVDRGDLERAFARSGRALGANPDSLDLRLQRAELEARANNFSVAGEMARSVLQNDPRSVPARNLLTDLALTGGRVDAAESTNKEALQLDPDDEIASILRARIADARGRREDAIGLLEAYRQANSERISVLALLTLAELHRLQGDLATAEQRLNEAARSDPGAVSVWLTRFRLLAAQNRYEEILALLGERSGEFADNPSVLLLGAAILGSTGQDPYLRDASNLFERVVAADPRDVDGHVGLAQVAYRLGDKERAEQAYRQVLSLDPYHEKALNDLAWILGVDLGKADEGLELANKGVARYPGNPHLFDTRGVLFEKLDRLAEARTDLDKCLTLAAGIPSTRAVALLHLGKVLVRQGDRPAARQRLDEALELDRQHGTFSETERDEIDHLLRSVSSDSASSAQDADPLPAERSRSSG